MADYYRDKRWVPVAAYSTATLIALSRVYSNQHWGSDVFVGSILGSYTARTVLRRQKEWPGEQTFFHFRPW